jgi:hypothetical protein
MAHHSGSGLDCLAVATAGATFVLLFLGGLVTSTGSGLAVVIPTTTHLVTGAALLATCLILTLRATRVTLFQPRAVAPIGVRRGAVA